MVRTVKKQRRRRPRREPSSRTGVIRERKEGKRALRMGQERLERKVHERTRALEEAQAQDRANLQRLRNIISHLSVGIIAFDENFRVLHANERFCSLFGIPSTEPVIGKAARNLLRYLRPAILTPPVNLGTISRVADKRKPIHGQEVHFRDGRVFLRDYLPVFDAGVFRGQIIMYRDITREKHVDTAKSDFMSFASHQLRTPLTAIRWALGRMRRVLLSEDPAHRSLLPLLDAAHRGTRSMADTINTMLSISSIEAGAVSLAVSEVRLHAFLRGLRESFRAELAVRRQRFVIHCAPSTRIWTDPRLLKEVLANIISNAIKYSPAKSEISVDVSHKGQLVAIAIKDRGHGIPAHEWDRVFQKFFRGEHAMQTLAEGSGLGLYLVSLLVQKLQGKVAFVSTRGGTTFTVQLPLAHGEA